MAGASCAPSAARGSTSVLSRQWARQSPLIGEVGKSLCLPSVRCSWDRASYYHRTKLWGSTCPSLFITRLVAWAETAGRMLGQAALSPPGQSVKDRGCWNCPLESTSYKWKSTTKRSIIYTTDSFYLNLICWELANTRKLSLRLVLSIHN